MDARTDRTMDPAVLRTWIGRTELHIDELNPASAGFMQQTLDRPATLLVGDNLPPLWHWIYFLSSARISDLGVDGHPAVGGFLPPVDLPRRMLAGGRLEFFSPLTIGEPATKTSTIHDVRVQRGRSGMLCFVTVRHEYVAGEDLRLAEEQDIVYRQDPNGAAAVQPQPPPPPPHPIWSEVVVPSEVMLFRYSALTFNGHRIHYDRDYCRDVESYPGLVVHGPLTATLLAELGARHQDRRLKTFSFRAIAPLYDLAPFTICGTTTEEGADLWAETPDGGLAMHAEATFA